VCIYIYKEKTTLIYPKINKKTFKKTSLNKYHSNKEVNTTSFVKHSKPLFYTYKHKYIYKKIERQQKKATEDLLLDNKSIPRTTTIFSFLFCHFLSNLGGGIFYRVLLGFLDVLHLFLTDFEGSVKNPW